MFASRGRQNRGSRLCNIGDSCRRPLDPAASCGRAGRSRFAGLVLICFALISGSCELFEENIADLWTDVPELALYVAEFNISQSKYKIHVSQVENLPSAVHRSQTKPALVVGRYLKSMVLRPYLQQLDYLFSELQLSERIFYPSLFSTGRMEDKQFLLPVSFNLPMMIFARSDDENRLNNFIIAMEELETRGKEFDAQRGSTYTSMGFSPRWNPEFMMALLQLQGADFREGDPFRWNRLALDPVIANLRAWITASHGSAAIEDDFQFRYLYIPDYKAIQEKRIRFAWMNSARYFALSAEHRSNLSFRWLGQGTNIRVEDDMVYAAIIRSAKGKDAAEAFIKWFYREDTQQRLLEDSRLSRMMEYSFGIAGGFSAIRSVNEKLFAEYYPELLGRLPPQDYLQATGSLPSYWPAVKREVLLPFLLTATSENSPQDLFGSLDAQLRTWLKQRSE